MMKFFAIRSLRQRLQALLLSLAVGLAAPALIAQDAAKQPQVLLKTSVGDITLELDPDKAPVTVANFLDYVQQGYYDGTVFHRVIKRFMIQGGGFTPELISKETGEPIVNESGNGLYNERWTIAMARTDDPDSATSQFFINLRMNPTLDAGRGQPGYAVFGRVVEGQHVVRDISLVATGEIDGMEDVPLEPVLIESAEVLQ